MQKTHECIYCVVDMHAITVWQDPAELKSAIRQVTAAYIASGLDPKKSILFNQSQVPEHAELAWVFNCVARLGWLNRMTQFKEKAGKDRENASVGPLRLSQPDGRRHSRLSRHARAGRRRPEAAPGAGPRHRAEVQQRLHATAIEAAGYADGVFFPLPEPVITGPATRVMSLRDGTKKMSKSDPSDLSRINLTDDADTIAKKIQKAPRPTRSRCRRATSRGSKARPEADNLVGIYAALAGNSKQGALDQLIEVRRQRSSRASRRRWPRWRSRGWRPIARRDQAADGRPGRDRPHPRRRLQRAPAPSPGRSWTR